MPQFCLFTLSNTYCILKIKTKSMSKRLKKNGVKQLEKNMYLQKKKTFTIRPTFLNPMQGICGHSRAYGFIKAIPVCINIVKFCHPPNLGVGINMLYKAPHKLIVIINYSKGNTEALIFPLNEHHFKLFIAVVVSSFARLKEP